MLKCMKGSNGTRFKREHLPEESPLMHLDERFTGSPVE